MSKIGKKAIEIPNGVTVNVEKHTITATGPKGTLSVDTKGNVNVKVEGSSIQILPLVEGDTQFQGLYRSLINNIIAGVKDGAEKKLELHGIGYRGSVQNGDLVLSVGYSHPVTVKKVDGITYTVTENVITVSGTNKVLVGDIAAKIRAIRKPNPYKGKGIRYQGEVIIKKETKSA